MIHLKIEHEDIDILRALEKRFWRIAESMGCTVEHRKKNEKTTIDRETVRNNKSEQ